jgi:hypothetical protein
MESCQPIKRLKDKKKKDRTVWALAIDVTMSWKNSLPPHLEPNQDSPASMPFYNHYAEWEVEREL